MPTTQPFDASSYIETALTTQTPTNFFPKDTIPQRSRDSTQGCCGWPPTRHLVKHFPRLSRNLWTPDGLVAVIVAGDLRAMLVTNGYSKYPDHDSLCLLGLNKEALVQELQPSLQDHIAIFLHWPIDVIAHQCSEEDERHLGQKKTSSSKGAGGQPHGYPQTLYLPRGDSCCQHGHLQQKARKFSFSHSRNFPVYLCLAFLSLLQMLP